MRKSNSELKNDFFTVLSQIKGSNGISITDFEALLRDISYTIDLDDDFIRVLIAW